MLAQQRNMIHQLIEQQAATQTAMREQQTAAHEQQAASNAQWEQRLASILQVGGAPPQHSSAPKTFKMKDPAKFCRGADNLDRFITQIKRLFKTHSQHFTQDDSDKVQYAIDLPGNWKENADESLRKTQMAHPDQWASGHWLRPKQSVWTIGTFSKRTFGRCTGVRIGNWTPQRKHIPGTCKERWIRTRL